MWLTVVIIIKMAALSSLEYETFVLLKWTSLQGSELNITTILKKEKKSNTHVIFPSIYNHDLMTQTHYVNQLSWGLLNNCIFWSAAYTCVHYYSMHLQLKSYYGNYSLTKYHLIHLFHQKHLTFVNISLLHLTWNNCENTLAL